MTERFVRHAYCLSSGPVSQLEAPCSSNPDPALLCPASRPGPRETSAFCISPCSFPTPPAPQTALASPLIPLVSLLASSRLVSPRHYPTRDWPSPLTALAGLPPPPAPPRPGEDFKHRATNSPFAGSIL